MILKKIKIIQQILFVSVLALLPFNVRYILNYELIRNTEGFREHLSLSIYVLDILLISLILFQIPFLLRNMLRSVLRNKLKDSIKKIFANPFFYFVLAVVISIIFSTYTGISLYNGFRIMEALIFLGISERFFSRYPQTKNWAVLAIFIGGVFQSLIAVLQFFLQKSVGLKILGESIIAPTILGVAKFEFGGITLIRSYGTFPHPNLLAAFLIFSLACGLWMLIHRKKGNEMLGVVGISGGIATIIIGIFLSYSRSAIIVTSIFLATIALTNKQWVVAKYKDICGKIKIHRTFHGGFALILFFALLFGIYNLLLPRMCLTNCPNDNSVPLRLIYNEKAFSTIRAHPFFGVGPGCFVEYAKEHLANNLNDWEFQPVHNIFLLISSEIGLLGLIAFLMICATKISKKKGKHFYFTKNPLLLVIFAYLILGLLDHYFWTLPQGQFLFWLSLAFFSK